MKNTKIDWCDATWNPVTGCRHGCEYCYARKIAERFGNPTRDGIYEFYEECRKDRGSVQPYPNGFSPTFHRYRLGIPKEWHKPRVIFVCSMADLFGDWVPLAWIRKVFDTCKAAPWHRYLFLTKNPKRYLQLADMGYLPQEPNFYYGTSVTSPDQDYFWADNYNTFLSVEPILEAFPEVYGDVVATNWVIVGAETGNRKDKVVPQKDWIDNIVKSCQKNNIPVFLKSSLAGIMQEELLQQYPWEGANEQNS